MYHAIDFTLNAADIFENIYAMWLLYTFKFSLVDKWFNLILINRCTLVNKNKYVTNKFFKENKFSI